MPPLMREYVRALIKDFVAAIELASEDCAGFSRELAEDLDALALAAVVGVSEALRDLLGQHECDQLGLLHRLKVLLIIIIFDFIATVNIVVKIGGINIIKHQMVILILQRLKDFIRCPLNHVVEVYQPFAFTSVPLGPRARPSCLFMGAGAEVEFSQVARCHGTGSANWECSHQLGARFFITRADLLRRHRSMPLQYLLPFGLAGGEE